MSVLSLGLALGIYHQATISRNPFHPDESCWIAKTQGWFLLIQGRFDAGFWIFEPLDQPMLVPYVFGAVSSLSGDSQKSINKSYDFKKDLETNRRERRVPSETLLRRCRRVSTLFGTLGCVFAMLLGWRLAGPAGGISAGLLLGLNPFYVQCVQRAMAEGLLAFWWLSGAWCCMRWVDSLRRQNRREIWCRTVMLGVVGGLSAMTKLTGAVILVVAPVVGVLELYLGRAGRGASRRGIVRLTLAACALVPVIGYLVFITQSPLTWHEPVEGPWAMMLSRSITMAGQADDYTEAALNSLAARGSVFAHHVWRDYGSLAAWIPASRLLWPDGVLFLIGLGTLLVFACRHLRANDDAIGNMSPDAMICLIWAAALSLPVALMNSLDWDRYYLPPLVASTVVQAVSVGRMLKGRVSNRGKLEESYQLSAISPRARDSRL